MGEAPKRGGRESESRSFNRNEAIDTLLRKVGQEPSTKHDGGIEEGPGNSDTDVAYDQVQFFYTKNGQIAMEGYFTQSASQLNQEFRYGFRPEEVPKEIRDEAWENTPDNVRAGITK